MYSLIILQSTPQSSGIASFLPIILIVLVFYFFMIRPQIKKQKEEDDFITSIKKGDKIVTMGGIHGRVKGVQDLKIKLEITENIEITIDKNAISKDKSVAHNK